MRHSFIYHDYKCELSAGYPVAFSTEQQNPSFLQKLAATRKLPENLSKKDLVSWIIARFTELTCGALLVEGSKFAGDAGGFGYRIKVSDSNGKRLGWWGVIFRADRIQLFGSPETDKVNGQTLIVEMLTESPHELMKCEIIIRNQDAGTKMTFGWNGQQFI